MRHIISILLENESGALSRVSGLFSARNYNIESLTVAPTDDDTVSRITIVARGNEAVIQQIIKQLNKLVDVVKVVDLTEHDHIEREILLIKVRTSNNGEQDTGLHKIAEKHQMRVLGSTDTVTLLEATATGQQLDDVLKDLSQFDIVEVVRSGVVGVGSGDPMLQR